MKSLYHKEKMLYGLCIRLFKSNNITSITVAKNSFLLHSGAQVIASNKTVNWKASYCPLQLGC